MQSHCSATHIRAWARSRHTVMQATRTHRCLHVQTDTSTHTHTQADMGAGFKIKQRRVTSIHPTCLQTLSTAESVPANATQLTSSYSSSSCSPEEYSCEKWFALCIVLRDTLYKCTIKVASYSVTFIPIFCTYMCTRYLNCIAKWAMFSPTFHSRHNEPTGTHPMLNN